MPVPCVHAGCCSITYSPDVLVGRGFGDTCPMTLDVKAARKGWVPGPRSRMIEPDFGKVVASAFLGMQQCLSL